MVKSMLETGGIKTKTGQTYHHPILVFICSYGRVSTFCCASAAAGAQQSKSSWINNLYEKLNGETCGMCGGMKLKTSKLTIAPFIVVFAASGGQWWHFSVSVGWGGRGDDKN